MGYQCAALQRPSLAVRGGSAERHSIVVAVLDAAQVIGELDAGHASDFVDRWQALDEAGDEVRGARTVAAVATESQTVILSMVRLEMASTCFSTMASIFSTMRSVAAARASPPALSTRLR